MKVEILRCENGVKPYRQTFIYEGDLHRSVAFVLEEINYRDDLYDINGTKSRRIMWECSCRQKQCGSCAMRICGRPALACSVFLDQLKLKNDTLVIEPLAKFPVIEDLRVDRSVLFDHLKTMEIWLDGEARIVPEKQFGDCYNSAKCLKCGLCLEVCPNYTGGSFAGPVAVAEGFLALCQGADVQKSVRKGFLSGCSKSGACQKICPARMETLGMIAKISGKRYR